MRVVAPGKLFWLGEYVVLEGAPAVVAAVDRCAVVTVRHAPEASTATLRSDAWTGAVEVPARTPQDTPEAGVFAAIAQAALDRWAREARIAGQWELQSAALSRGTKLGLGSSSAIAAGVACAMAPPDAPARDVEAVALAGHRRFQGGAGSGADVLAALWGGLLRIEAGAAQRLEIPAGLKWAVIFSGTSAQTAPMVAAVRAWRDADPVAAARVFAAMGGASRRGCAALEAGDARGFVEAVASFADAEASLDGASGAGILSPAVKACVESARSAGWVAKPSGAGGGDVVVAFGLQDADRDALRWQVQQRGLEMVAVELYGAGALEER